MTFTYNETTISGGNVDEHGVSGLINAITDNMVSSGWIIDDDRRGQPGSATLSLTHKVVLNSDGGESGSSPNIYVTITSGTAAATTATTIGFQISGAYDNVAHAVPASGVKSPNTTTLSQMRVISCDPDGYNRLWMACDQDAFSLVNNYAGSSYQTCHAGRGDNFLGEDLEPYGAYLSIFASVSAVASSVYGLLGNNTVQQINSTNDTSFVAYTMAASNNPTRGMGNNVPRYAAMPIVWVAANTSPLQKGWVGYVKHIYSGVTHTEGLPTVGEAVDLATGKEFKVFGSASTFFMRKN